MERSFDAGMYIIDEDYRIINFNRALESMYPNVKCGDFCYNALALTDGPCATCPLISGDATLFFNPVRKEWISASAAEMEYPGHGRCYNIQFRRKTSMGGSREEIIRQDKIEEYISDLQAATGREAVIGAYYEPGAPVFYANEAFVSMLAYDSIDELLDAVDGLVSNTVHPEDRDRVLSDMSRAKAEGDIYETTYRMQKSDGSWLWAVTKGKLIRTESGRLASMSICTDMSEVLRRTESLREQMAAGQRNMEMLLHNIPGGYHRVGVNGGFPLIFVSDSFLDIVGRSREELTDTAFLDIVAPEDRESFMALEPELASTGQIHAVYRIVRGDGQRRWVQDSTQKIMQNGEEYYQCTLADITDFIKRQEEMARQNMELSRRELVTKAMEENMPSGYHRCAAEPGLPFQYIGRNFLDIVGFTAEEIEQELGNLYSNIIWGEDAQQIGVYEDMLYTPGKGNSYDTSVYRVKHRDGGYRWVTDSTMFVDMGENSFFQGTIADITEYIEELEDARRRAEESSQAKSAFLFNASHDIRTPMNAIQGFAHIIERNADNAGVVLETIRKVKQSGDTLMTLLNDVLELSRIERGKEDVSLQPLDMLAYANKLYEMFAGEIQKAGLSFIMENAIVHNRVLGDELKLTRIAMNLLSNARKFTPRGGSVSFGVREGECDGKSAVYHIVVRDTGIGMSEEFQARAFEQFERERSSTESGVAGSGLGLAIIKKLVELMDGSCSIESAPGKGSAISVNVRLPLAGDCSDSGSGGAAEACDFAGKRILLVEDNEFNREIARYILEDMGFIVEEAENGEVCVNMVRDSRAGYYDLVLMDIQMPVLDGYSATVIVRRMAERSKAGLPIVAMTANAFDEDRRKCLEVGMNGHIGKPIEPDVLKQTLIRIL